MAASKNALTLGDNSACEPARLRMDVLKTPPTWLSEARVRTLSLSLSFAPPTDRFLANFFHALFQQQVIKFRLCGGGGACKKKKLFKRIFNSSRSTA